MEKDKKKLTIHQIFWYFLIFSIAGLIIETVYGYISSGVIESRKGFIWGPLCPVYGVCGVVLIWALNKIEYKNVFQLFISGFVVGSVAEYALSYILEAIYGVRFWNYEYLKFNLNGRISLMFSIYWGILAVLIMKLLKPCIDKLVENMKPSVRNVVEIMIFIFLLIDCFMTIWGISTYENRVLYNIEYKAESSCILPRIREKIENDYFTNERMSTIFPNIRVKDVDGQEVWIKTLIND